MKKKACILLLCVIILLTMLNTQIFADGFDLPDDNFGPEIVYLELADTEGKLKMNNGYLYGLSANQKAASVISHFNNQKNVTVRKDGEILADDALAGTGASVCVVNSNGLITNSVSIVVMGDTSGDGIINSADYLKVKRAFNNEFFLRGAFYKAGDINGDGIIRASDYLKIKRHISGTYNLYE